MTVSLSVSFQRRQQPDEYRQVLDRQCEAHGAAIGSHQPAAINIAKAPPAGLTCLASAPDDAWQRQMVSTVNSSYSWHTATAASDTTTYSINVAAFPGATKSGFEAMMYLIPVTGMSNPGRRFSGLGLAMWTYFTITGNADGTGRGNFRYKVTVPVRDLSQLDGL